MRGHTRLLYNLGRFDSDWVAENAGDIAERFPDTFGELLLRLKAQPDSLIQLALSRVIAKQLFDESAIRQVVGKSLDSTRADRILGQTLGG